MTKEKEIPNKDIEEKFEIDDILDPEKEVDIEEAVSEEVEPKEVIEPPPGQRRTA